MQFATLKTIIYMVKNDTFFDISIFPNELVFARLPKMNLADFIIVQIQAQIHVAEKENSPAIIFEKWKISY